MAALDLALLHCVLLGLFGEFVVSSDFTVEEKPGMMADGQGRLKVISPEEESIRRGLQLLLVKCHHGGTYV